MPKPQLIEKCENSFWPLLKDCHYYSHKTLPIWYEARSFLACKPSYTNQGHAEDTRLSTELINPRFFKKSIKKYKIWAEIDIYKVRRLQNYTVLSLCQRTFNNKHPVLRTDMGSADITSFSQAPVHYKVLIGP